MKIENLLDYQTILANQARPVHFAIRFDAPSVEQPRPRPAAFCVVLDRSGSMEGQALKHAKAATQLAVRNLRPEDQFSLVIFDDVSRCVIPLQHASQGKSWSNMIDQIDAGGSTNLTAGWMLGRDELKKTAPDVMRRLLLLSDGLLNVGIVEPNEVKGIIGSGLEKDSIRTSCLGFGDNYNEDVMSGCARAASGQFYDAKSPDQLPAIFASELDGLQKIVIQNLRVRIKRLDFCDAYQLLGEYPTVDLPDDRKEIMVGDLVSSETRILCFELGVLPLPLVNGQPVCSLEGEALLELEFVFDEISASGVSSKTVSQVIRIQATQNPDDVKIREEVIPWVAMQKAGRVMEEVNKRMDSGSVQEAATLLDNTIAELKQYGPADKVAEAVQRLEHLRALIEGGAFSLEERKASKYRSSSYRRMSSSEMWSMREKSPSFKKQPPTNPPTP
jgi:Ca-activated chloride channel family protein